MNAMRIPALVLLVAGLSACPWESDDKDSPYKRATELTADDFAASAMTSLDDVDFLDEFYDNDDFVNERERLLTSGNEPGSCFEKKFGDPLVTRNANGTHRFELTAANLQECIPAFFVTITQSFASSLFDNMVIVDQFGNPANFESRRLSELGGYLVERTMLRMSLYTVARVTSDEGPVETTAASYYSSAAVDDFNGACSIVGDISGCRIMSLSTFSAPALEFSDAYYADLKTSELFATEGEPYYYGGHIDFRINNWSGRVSYGSTGNDLPVYLASDGSTTLEGSYDSDLAFFKAAVQAPGLSDTKPTLRQLTEGVRKRILQSAQGRP